MVFLVGFREYLNKSDAAFLTLLESMAYRHPSDEIGTCSDIP